MMEREELRELLERLHDRYNSPAFIADDPVGIPHAFTDPHDIEISGFMASTIAWGNRKAIVKSARRMMEMMDGAPFDFVVNATDAETSRLESYVHRTFNGGDFHTFVLALRRMERLHGGIGAFFQKEYLRTGGMPQALSAFRREFFNFDHRQRTQKHLSSIDKGAACKRLNMYLRWMVRDDGRGVDFGLWKAIPSSALYLPLDVHSANMSRALGLLSRRQNDWKAVEEVTAALRELDSSDPVKYDFALFGAGIDGFLKG